MKHLLFLLLSVTAAAVGSRAEAQSLVNTNWKAYVAEPIYDTIVWHIRTDSSFVTITNGTVVVRSTITVVKDTLSVSDFDGQYSCPNTTGKYRFSLEGDMLHFTLVEDPCEGRAAAITTGKWKKVPATAAK